MATAENLGDLLYTDAGDPQVGCWDGRPIVDIAGGFFFSADTLAELARLKGRTRLGSLTVATVIKSADRRGLCGCLGAVKIASTSPRAVYSASCAAATPSSPPYSPQCYGVEKAHGVDAGG